MSTTTLLQSARSVAKPGQHGDVPSTRGPRRAPAKSEEQRAQEWSAFGNRELQVSAKRSVGLLPTAPNAWVPRCRGSGLGADASVDSRPQSAQLQFIRDSMKRPSGQT